MHILHTESSTGWGGQEIRILREAEAMRRRGYSVSFAVQHGAKLVARARERGFDVASLSFSKSAAPWTIASLVRLCKQKGVSLINTHSSRDAWLGGIAGRLAGVPLIRTRHLSTPTRSGLNSRLLYGKLADYVVTTCSAIVPSIRSQGGLLSGRVLCVPTGIEPNELNPSIEEVEAFRRQRGVGSRDILIGTACVVRSWKGIPDFIRAAWLLRHREELKWIIVGGGYLDTYRPLVAQLGLSDRIQFTGHLDNPFAAIRAMDVFALLSSANEGISQASLQAAYLERPLITTPVGGLPEVCLDGKTGIVVPIHAPESVAQAVERFAGSSELRIAYGSSAKALVLEKFTFTHTLDEMERIYSVLKNKVDKKIK